MSKLWQVTLGAGLVVVLAVLVPFSVIAQGGKGKDPEWKHGMKLRVREAGKREFTKETPEFGVEVFSDDNSNHLVYIDEKANLALVKGAAKEGAAAPTWLHAMDFSVRKAGETEFTKTTKRYGVEVFRDENTPGNLVYMSSVGSVAVVPGGAASPPGAAAKEPTWTHAFELQVRKAGERDFDKNTKKYGVEVFRDENNNNLVYISETGSIAVVSGVTTMGKTAPDWKYGFEVAARKAGEAEFDKTTKRYNIEVFQDVNNGNVIYVSETGALAVLPGVKVAAATTVKAPEWKYASDLAVRKASEEKFTKTTTKYGVEFYLDANDGLMVAISQDGSLAIMPGK